MVASGDGARLYVSGLGYYEASLNGERVGDHVLDPGWTMYGKRVYYIDQGSFLEVGPPDQVIDKPQNPSTEKFLTRLLNK